MRGRAVSPRLVSERIVTARVTHDCMTCARVAAIKGETYTRTTLAYDGTVYDWIQCQPCRRIALSVAYWSTSADGIGQGDYADWADEHRDDPGFGPTARAYLARLTPASNQGAHDA